MKAFRITNTPTRESKEIIADSIIRAQGFLDKLFGLTIRRKLDKKKGFLLYDCNSIHTLWMRYSIDVIFMDINGRVLAVFNDLKPFRVTPFIKNAAYALEMASGSAGENSLKAGDNIQFED